MEEIRQVSSEKEIWGFINRGRKSRDQPSEKITLDDWRAHFIKLLKGDGNRILVTWKREEIAREEEGGDGRRD